MTCCIENKKRYTEIFPYTGYPHFLAESMLFFDGNQIKETRNFLLVYSLLQIIYFFLFVIPRPGYFDFYPYITGICV